MARRLIDPPYLRFPLTIDAGGPSLASRSEHIRGQIEQVLFTLPGERVFRPDFGAGVKALVFEPNSTPLWQITKRRLLASLADALQGEVDPKSIEVEVSGEEATLTITIGYTLAAIGLRESQIFTVGGG
nr:GPW/gp25 family protein [uncultured Desulfobulbus sp.]